MPTTPLPNSASLSEANPCHHPPGSPKGGQFCAKQGGTWAAGEFEGTAFRGGQISRGEPGVRKPLGGLPRRLVKQAGLSEREAETLATHRDAVMAASFQTLGAGRTITDREHLVVVDMQTGQRLNGMGSGTLDSVEVPHSAQVLAQQSRSSLMIMHSHPSSQSFSTQDIRMQLLALAVSPAQRIAVVGRDGSVYTLRVNFDRRRTPGQFASAVFTEMATAYARTEDWSRRQTQLYALRKLGLPESHPRANDLQYLDAENRKAGRDMDEVFNRFKQIALDLTYRKAARDLNRVLGAGMVQYASHIPKERRAWVRDELNAG